MLAELKTGKGDHEDTLAKLFRADANRIEDLAAALNDPDSGVVLWAVIALRYLGDEAGINTVYQFHERPGYDYRRAGPVPQPLREWDFRYLESVLLDPAANSGAWWGMADHYVYALALDSSPWSKKLLDLITERVRRSGNQSTPLAAAVEGIAREDPRAAFREGGDLAAAVRKRAFFLGPKSRGGYRAQVLAKTAAKDKALVELSRGTGALDDEVWHVVVVKRGSQWKFFSILLARVS